MVFSACAQECVKVFIYIYICLYAQECVKVFIYICLYAQECVMVFIYIYICIYIYIYRTSVNCQSNLFTAYALIFNAPFFRSPQNVGLIIAQFNGRERSIC